MSERIYKTVGHTEVSTKIRLGRNVHERSGGLDVMMVERRTGAIVSVCRE